MNKTVLTKEGNNYSDFIIEHSKEIDASRFLATYKDCNVIEERYKDGVLIETIKHQL